MFSAEAQEVQYDTVNVIKGSKILKTVTVISKTERIISVIDCQKINPALFSDQEIKSLENGNVVKKISKSNFLPVKLFPIVEMQYYKEIIFYKLKNGIVKKINRKPVIGNPEKDLGMSIL